MTDQQTNPLQGLQLQCIRCGHQWFRRILDTPKQCPNCKTTFWNRERVNATPEEWQAQKRHQHRAIESQSKDYAWSHCVTPEVCAAQARRQNAHGNIVRRDICACGATRETEINTTARNYGPWQEPDEQAPPTADHHGAQAAQAGAQQSHNGRKQSGGDRLVRRNSASIGASPATKTRARKGAR